MPSNIETVDVDRRYERCRLRSATVERRLLSEIASVGIQEALTGAVVDSRYVLVDGFKRLRCARSLGLASVPFRSLGTDETSALVALLRQASLRGPTLIEQAWLVDELRVRHGLSIVEIARHLEKSHAWVSLRIGLSTELSPKLAEWIGTGAFPAHAYLSSVRPLTRVTGASTGDVEEFVGAVAGKGLTVRELDVLVNAYFTGTADFKRQLTTGDVRFCLEALRQPVTSRQRGGTSEVERAVVRDIDLVVNVGKRLRRRLGAGGDGGSDALRAESHHASGRLLALLPPLTRAVEDFHARSRPQESDRDHAREGGEQAPDRALARREPHDGA